MSLKSLQDRFEAAGYRFVTECIREARLELMTQAASGHDGAIAFLGQVDTTDWSSADPHEVLIELRRIEASMRARDLDLAADVIQAAIRDYVGKTIRSTLN